MCDVVAKDVSAIHKLGCTVTNNNVTPNNTPRVMTYYSLLTFPVAHGTRPIPATYPNVVISP